MSTLERYREDKNLEGDRRDPMEGRLNLDAKPFLARRLFGGGFRGAVRTLSARATFAASPDPWVFCTAFCPVREREAYKLARRLSSDYDSITDILDVNMFALELGIDFSIMLDAAIHTMADSGMHVIQRELAANSGFDKVVHMVHGPVAYEDTSGTLNTSLEPSDLRQRFCFTKPKVLSYQSEYRFALWSIGKPSTRTLRIPVSDALRECMSIR
ncbi:MAG: hypothetical protein OXH99_06915 [Bryobacterales bacterium]|nr:hypothetical protein [Bryobacterales bacterium]